MKTLLIVRHSRTGGAQQMARSAAAAARNEPDLATRLLPAGKAQPGDLFACPENLAALPGAMKEFFDRCYYPVLDRINGRPYAMLICAGSDGDNAVRQIRRIATGWRLREVADPVIVRTNAQTPETIMARKHIGSADLARCATLGATLAAGLAMGVF